MGHVRPRLSVYGRLLLVQRVASGRPVAHVAAELGVSRATAHKWIRRFRHEGAAGLEDRSSRPHRSPTRTAAEVEAEIVRLRVQRRLGPARIAGILGMHPSTVHRVLTRHHLPRLAWLDRPTGRVIRRYERERPGDLVHVDIKKIGRIRDGGGWRVHGQQSTQRTASRTALRRGERVGFEYVHSAVDDHSRLAYAEIHPDEKATTAAAFWARAVQFVAAHGIAAAQVLTDNGSCYRSRDWATSVAATGTEHLRTRPYRPQTNGKVERLNRTMLEEWAYARPFASGEERQAALTTWLHTYNHHRTHTSLGGQPPITRVDNLTGHYN